MTKARVIEWQLKYIRGIFGDEESDDVMKSYIPNMKKAIKALIVKEKEIFVVNEQFYNGLTVAKLSEILGLSSQRVYKLRINACRRLRSHVGRIMIKEGLSFTEARDRAKE